MSEWRIEPIRYRTVRTELLSKMEAEGWTFVSSYGDGHFRDQQDVSAYFIFKRERKDV